MGLFMWVAYRLASRMSYRQQTKAILGVLFLASACSVNLQHDLVEEDANEIYVLLQKKSIDATKIKEGEGKETRYLISVPKADVATAAELLRAYSLPRPKADGLAVFKQTKGMIPTQTEERAMFMEAVGGEVSNALNRIPGVLEAKTIVMIPDGSDLAQPEKKPQPSASVLVKFMASEGKPPVATEDIQAFVANAVPELKRENVKVLMTEARFVSEATEEPRFQRFLAVNVERASTGTFKTLIGILGIVIMALATVVGFLLIRRAPSPQSQE